MSVTPALSLQAKIASTRTKPVRRIIKPRAHNRHQDLLLAAAQVFRAKGYAQASMRDIPQAADLIAGPFFYHYPPQTD